MTTTACPIHDELYYPFERDMTKPFDPAPEVAALRQGRPVSKVKLWNGKTAWLVTRLADCRAILGSRSFSSVPAHENYPMLSPGVAATKKQDASFIRKDPPRHTAERRMWQPFFNAANVKALVPGIQRYADEAIDTMLEVGPPADFVENFALNIPSRVISELLAVPDGDHTFFQKHSAVRAGISPTPEEITQANVAMEGYWWSLVNERLKNPGDDLVSQVIVKEVNSGNITAADAVAMAQLMLFAGHDTTANMFALGTLTLLQNPSVIDRMRADPEVTPRVVEELLRYLSIVQNGLQRVALEDVQVGDILIPAGDGIIIHVAGGNRDETYFEAPDEFNPDRKVGAHVAFGAGAHACIGAPLARIELQIGLDTLFRRLPDLALAVPLEDIQFKTDALFYGVKALPVTW